MPNRQWSWPEFIFCFYRRKKGRTWTFLDRPWQYQLLHTRHRCQQLYFTRSCMLFIRGLCLSLLFILLQHKIHSGRTTCVCASCRYRMCSSHWKTYGSAVSVPLLYDKLRGTMLGFLYRRTPLRTVTAEHGSIIVKAMMFILMLFAVDIFYECCIRGQPYSLRFNDFIYKCTQVDNSNINHLYNLTICSWEHT